MDSKKWYTSKTLWANTVAITAIIAQGITGKDIIPAEYQAVFLGVVNTVLRIVTKTEVVW